MYCILFLHQTTTVKRLRVAIDRCIASSFYIKPQLAHRAIGAFICCIASSFYIKPQQSGDTGCRRTRCIASSFYIKPQHLNRRYTTNKRCIASSFYIKPQHDCELGDGCKVVLHPLSTSNHNMIASITLNQLLYCILFLHQTTTTLDATLLHLCCIASSFYIKPQPQPSRRPTSWGCIASSFYIKPQPQPSRRPTSWGCIASSFYIKPQQSTKTGNSPSRCIASSFYIKPQLLRFVAGFFAVVLHPLSTSNHNSKEHITRSIQVVLHPLSTSNHNDIV